MIKVGDKFYRNLEEQVQYLTNYHDVNQGLVQWGIRVVGQVETADELPLPYDGEYGDAIAVGTEAPFFFYIWTRASIEGNPAYWFPFGEISTVGPEGPVGPRGEKGDTGEASKWYVGSVAPSATSIDAKPNDMYLQTSGGTDWIGTVWYYKDAEDGWLPTGNIRGPQGTQGIQGIQGPAGPEGPQGPKGDTGDVGGFINIIGLLSNVNQLPLPSTLNNLTYAYLVEHTGGTDQANDHYDLYIQVGETSAEAVWTNVGPFNAATLVTVNGYGQNVWDADTKLDKRTNISGYSQVYVKSADGSQSSIDVSTGNVANAIVQRQGNGNITVPATPTNTTDAVSKQYADNSFVHTVRPAEKNLYYIPALSVDNNNNLQYWSIKATPDPSGEKIIIRSKQGRAQMQDPVEDMDITNKRWVNSAISNKLDKDTSTTTYNQVYVKNANGGQAAINVTKQLVADCVPQRKSDSNITVPETPTSTTDAASKGYVDTNYQPKLTAGTGISISSSNVISSTASSQPKLKQWIVRVFDYIANVGYFEVFFNVLAKEGTTVSPSSLLTILNTMGINDSTYLHSATGAVGDINAMKNKVIGVYYSTSTALGIAYDSSNNVSSAGIANQSITLTSSNTTIKVYDPLG